jgi:hypothetical protein
MNVHSTLKNFLIDDSKNQDSFLGNAKRHGDLSGDIDFGFESDFTS